MNPVSTKSYTHHITLEDQGSRLDTFLAYRHAELTRSRAQDLIKSGCTQVNGHLIEKTSYRLKNGDLLEFLIPPAETYHVAPEPMELDVIYEDKNLIILNKPPGIVVHPAPGHATGTLVHGLLQHCRDLSGIGGVLRPGIVHRLDKDTSGLVLVAKNDHSHVALACQFAAGEIHKRYLALVHGRPLTATGKVDLPIGRHPFKRKEMSVRSDHGKAALTFWERIHGYGEHFSLLSVAPQTGRTHQIRVHLSHIGHPVLGDLVYGFKKKWWQRLPESQAHILPLIKRQMLHAASIGFAHPDSGETLEFTAPMPADMAEVIRALSNLL